MSAPATCGCPIAVRSHSMPLCPPVQCPALCAQRAAAIHRSYVMGPLPLLPSTSSLCRALVLQSAHRALNELMQLHRAARLAPTHNEARPQLIHYRAGEVRPSRRWVLRKMRSLRVEPSTCRQLLNTCTRIGATSSDARQDQSFIHLSRGITALRRKGRRGKAAPLCLALPLLHLSSFSSTPRAFPPHPFFDLPPKLPTPIKRGERQEEAIARQPKAAAAERMRAGSMRSVMMAWRDHLSHNAVHHRPIASR